MAPKKDESFLMSIANSFHNNVQTLNNSKIFAGIMIVTLNIASRFVDLRLSKTMEAYLKYSFSRQVLVFAITWMGTRDIYIALFITTVFTIIMEYLCHEESRFCILPNQVREYYVGLHESGQTVTNEDVKRAKEVLEKASKQSVGNSAAGKKI
jgi:hypothetical protein